KYQVKPPFPFTPGAEVAGLVDTPADGFPVGARVLAAAMGGAFAEHTVAPIESVALIPDSMNFAEAAAMPVVYHTSYFALVERAALKSGEWLLVHAGASGVGMAAIQIGKALGARVVATAGSAAKLDFCRAQGAEQAYDYNDAAWVDRVKEVT